MKSITVRPFSVLADCGKIYQFMLDIYEKDWRNGVPAPFFEYAYSSFEYWMDITYSYKNRIWEEQGEIVAFCFYEAPVTDIYFCLKPGYEELAVEMIAYADENMSIRGGKIRLVLFGEQNALTEAAVKRGYSKKSESWDMQFDFEEVLDYPLPEGFHFVKAEEYDMAKGSKCCWKGFNHEEKEGSWEYQHEQTEYLLQVAPHAKLAYMEPLCTIPEYRNRGLAAAALSELYRRTKSLGATHMTGGTNKFYEKIGFKPAVKWTYWTKE